MLAQKEDPMPDPVQPVVDQTGARRTASDPDAPLLPARMLNEYVYCPRLFALQWMNRLWADSADTVRGRSVHRRVDTATDGAVPHQPAPQPKGEQEGDPPPQVGRSVYLSDEALHLVARIDLVEARDGLVIPVDYKKGHAPRVPAGAYDPERVQVCAQGLLLRAHGYTCQIGVLYFVASRRRVEVVLDDELVSTTLRARDEALACAADERLPPPLVDDPRCVRCALVGICLPDEQNFLNARSEGTRCLVPRRDDAMPLYAQMYGGRLSKDHDEIVIRDRHEVVGRARLEETSRVVVMGNISVTTPLLVELSRRNIPVAYHSYGGWFHGVFHNAGGQNVMTRIAQHRMFQDPPRALVLARAFVHGKVLNCRVMLRRNAREVSSQDILRLKEIAQQVERAPTQQALMGHEGSAASIYFQNFRRMIRDDLYADFDFTSRNRRPPRDRVNSLLSLAYAFLAREITTILQGIGMDPYVGFLHRPRYGRPSLALDLMEEFRPILADSVVITAVNTQAVQAGDFIINPTGVALTRNGRRKFIRTWERRLHDTATHPTFGFKLSYRRILEVQARLLGKVLLGELDTYPEFRVR